MAITPPFKLCPARLGVVILALTLPVGWAGTATAGQPMTSAFGFSQVVAMAEHLAHQPYEAPRGIPEFLAKLTYDQWRDIRFKPQKATWRGEPSRFQVQFFHPGFLQHQIVTINEVRDGKVQPILFAPDDFTYGANTFKARVPADLGFAGFRLHYPLNTETYYDEVLVFLGASYFRAVGRNEQYGLSARGLAIDTATDEREEFPYFKEFWLVKPHPHDQNLTIYALLDGASVCGAYQFILEPGEDTRLQVRLTLFTRRRVKKLGMAPLTSMFFYGENTNQRPIDDFRPEIHDSDGLLIADGGDGWIWRPLNNPRGLTVSTFPTDHLKGFGLLQRDLNFDHYQDLESLYHKRPSAWITPQGNWGPGHVELVEIPATQEIEDNIVAFWVPDRMPAPYRPLTLAYCIHWRPADLAQHGPARVVATRRSSHRGRDRQRFLVDFDGTGLNEQGNTPPLKADIRVGRGARLVEEDLQKNPFNNTMRLTFVVTRDKGTPDQQKHPHDMPPVELEAVLMRGGTKVSETWHYRLEK
jgi:periplasmic glucans biosynthesis protein